MSTLNELIVDTLKTLTQIEESGGELTPDLEQTMDLLAGGLAKKVDSYVMLIKQLESQEATYRTMAREFGDKAKTMASNIDALKERLKQGSLALSMDKLEGEHFEIKFSTTVGRLVISDEELVPPQFKNIVQTIEIDKAKIKAKIIEGATISGCFIEAGKAIRISPKHKSLEAK